MFILVSQTSRMCLWNHIKGISLTSPQTKIADLVQIVPEDFNKDAAQAIEDNINAKYAREWSGGILTDIEVEGTLRDYEGDFPLMTEPRLDRRIDIEVGATFRTLAMKGFAPRLEYAYSQNFSNVELYDYNKSTVSLFVTKRRPFAAAWPVQVDTTCSTFGETCVIYIQ